MSATTEKPTDRTDPPSLAPSSPRRDSSPPDAVSEPPPPPRGGPRGLVDMVLGMIRTMRPHQWVKNLFVLAPVVFAKNLTHPSIIKSAVGAFLIFCLLAGSIYTLNDLLDVEADRHHPVKRHRPIASGRVPLPVARAMVIVLLALCLAGALMGPWRFLVVALAYFILQTAYSFRLKQVAYVDVGCIAAGFVLRVLAGGFATKTPVSWYMIACTAFLALFLGFGKRRHEITAERAIKQRKALQHYSERVLYWALAITGFASVATYTLYTLDTHTRAFFQSEWLWLTTIHPLFGVLRFLHIVRSRPRAESPTQEMLRDVPFVLNLVIWIIEVIVVVYQLRPAA
jgi:decaprenyl-phosphate phosphoribosyltransferase